MVAAAFSTLVTMETEESQIATGLRRRDPDVLDALIEQYQHRLLRLFETDAAPWICPQTPALAFVEVETHR